MYYDVIIKDGLFYVKEIKSGTVIDYSYSLENSAIKECNRLNELASLRAEVAEYREVLEKLCRMIGYKTYAERKSTIDKQVEYSESILTKYPQLTKGK